MKKNKGFSNFGFLLIFTVLIVVGAYSTYAYVNQIPFPWSVSGGGYMIKPINDSTILRIINEETKYYNNKYNVELPPINWVQNNTPTINTSYENVSGSYHTGGSATWTSAINNITHYEVVNATITLFSPSNMTPERLRHVVRHELGHHYIASICGYGGYYKQYGNYGSEELSYPEKLPKEFEEPFVEGYTSNTLGTWYEPTKSSMFYWDFKGLSSAMFECGFNTCNLYDCYEKYIGEPWSGYQYLEDGLDESVGALYTYSNSYVQNKRIMNYDLNISPITIRGNPASGKHKMWCGENSISIGLNEYWMETGNWKDKKNELEQELDKQFEVCWLKNE